MRELKNGTKIIGMDHGYGNIKTANTIMPTGITAYPTKPTFEGNILQYDGMYYRIGEGINAHGWMNIKNADGKTRRYHFDDKGKMDTGWKDIDGSWYYFHDTIGSSVEGAMYVSDQDGRQRIAILD